MNVGSYNELDRGYRDRRLGGTSFTVSMEDLAAKSAERFHTSKEEVGRIADMTDHTFQKMQQLEKQPYLQKQYYMPKLKKKK